MLDDELCVAIGVADAEPAKFHLNGGQRQAFVAAMAAEAGPAAGCVANVKDPPAGGGIAGRVRSDQAVSFSLS